MLNESPCFQFTEQQEFALLHSKCHTVMIMIQALFTQ